MGTSISEERATYITRIKVCLLPWRWKQQVPFIVVPVRISSHSYPAYLLISSILGWKCSWPEGQLLYILMVQYLC